LFYEFFPAKKIINDINMNKDKKFNWIRWKIEMIILWSFLFLGSITMFIVTLCHGGFIIPILISLNVLISGYVLFDLNKFKGK